MNRRAILLPLFLSVALSAQTGVITTVAGTGVAGSGGVGGPAVNAQLYAPGGIAVDSADNLYIADASNNRVVRVDAATGILTLVAGNGVAASAGDLGPAAQASVYHPYSVALDAAGNLFISESSANRIRRVDAATGIITTAVGTGTGGWSGDGGPAANATIRFPAGIVIDPSGNLYIADAANYRIRRVDGQSGIITTVAGNGLAQAAPDGSVAVNASLFQPMGVAVDHSGNLFISEYGTSSVRRVDATTGVLTTVAGNGNSTFTGDAIPATGAGIGRLAANVTVDSAGNLYFADGTGRVRRVDAATGKIGTVAGNGSGAQGVAASGGGGGGGCYSTPIGDNGPAASATLDGPVGVSLTSNGNLLVSDWLDCRVRRVSLPSPYPYTTTSLTGTTGTISNGQQVTYTVTVSPIGASGIPTGAIQLVDALPFIAPVVLATAQLQNGSITFWMTTPSVGGHNIVAYYSGDGLFNGSGSVAIPLTVSSQAVPTVALSSSVNPVAVNASTTLTVTVTPPAGNSNQPTGSVEIFDGSTLLTTGSLTNGTMQYAAAFAGSGIHPLSAVYLGDGNFARVTSSTLTQTVQAPSSVTLAADANPSTLGSTVTYTATLTPSSATGTVQFTDGAVNLGTAALAGGTATLAVPNLALGVHYIQAVYGGDGTVAAASSPVLTQTVRTATTTTLSSSAMPSTYRQTVTFTAAVSPASATGTVQFADGATVLGSASLSGGSAVLAISTLTGGSHTITATYNGDSANSGSTSAPLAQSVSAATPVIRISTFSNPTTVGSFVLFSMSMTPASPGATLSVMDGQTVLAVVPTSGGGAASYSTTALTAGYHSITASWAGDGNVLAGASAVLNEQVQASTTTSATATGSITFGQSVTVTATVSPAGATGTVQFNDAGNNLGTVPLSSGVASITYAPSSAGSHQTVATFHDDSGIYISSVGSVTIEVAKVISTITVASSVNPSNVGQLVMLTATMSATGAAGNVQFFDGAAFIGNAPLNSGVATLYKIFQTGGSHSITASYEGNSNYAAVTSPAMVQTVKTATTTALSGAGTSTYGQAVPFVATVSPAAATGTIQFLDGTTTLGTVAVSAGSATLNVASLGVGSHAITAIYGGDATYAGSTSAVATQTVQKASVTVTLTSSVNPSLAGQAIGFTAVLSDSTATGTIQFLDGAAVVGTVTVSGGSAVLTTSDLNAGSHTITAAYSGDGNFAANSAGLTQMVKAITNTSVAANPSPAVFGQAVQVTASVSPTAATGSVQFLDGSTPLGTSTISNGAASISVSTPAVGSHNLTAIYSGDSGNAGSTSAVVALTVSKASSSAVLSAAPNPTTFGQVATFTATVSPNTATGSVQFLDGSTVIGAAAVSGGTASVTISTLAAGTHSVTAVYGGDASYTGSTSPAVIQTVNKAASAIGIASSTNPATYGQTVTLTATVSPGAATGSVQFFDGSTAMGTAALNGGAASLSVSALAAGTHSITAVYGGDASYSSATSGAIAQTVNKAGTAVAMTSSANPGTSGQPVTFTATVAPAQATGSVQFLDGATVIGTAAVSGGVAAVSTSSLGVGSHTISAAYSGDANYAASTSAGLVEVIKIATTTTLASNANTSIYSHAVQFTATVSQASATGSVQFYDGAALIGTGTVSAGKATLTTSALTGGSHSMSAVYSGDSTYLASASAALTQTVTKAASTASVASSDTTSIVGQAVTFTASVSPSSVTGSVQFLDGSTVLATVALSNASAAYTTSSLAAGSHRITVQYTGDGNYNPDASSGLTQSVSKANTSTTLTSTPNPSQTGQSVTFTATVSAATATGTVQFSDGNKSLGTAAVSGGAATFTTSTLSSGSHNIKATYSGDAAFNGSASALLKQTVN